MLHAAGKYDTVPGPVPVRPAVQTRWAPRRRTYMGYVFPPKQAKRDGLGIVLVLAVIHFLAHTVTNGNYGMFRDEFYYIACADHLNWGYVDQPPLSIALLAGSKALLGESVRAVRFPPAVAGAFLILLTGIVTRELGGGRFAQVLAAMCVMIAPSYLVMTGFFSMNAFDLLFWILAFYVLIRIVKTGNSKLWLLMGLILGLGLLNKIGLLVFGLALAGGLLLTPNRKYLLDKHLWGGAAIALLIVLPNILWQMANGWPTLEFIRNAKEYKIADFTPLQFFMGQVVENHPMNALIWLAGLGFILFAKRMRPYRIIGLIFALTFVILVVQKSKVYYMAPVFPVMMAAGAISVEAVCGRRHWRWFRVAALLIVVSGGIATLPMGLPVLSPDAFVNYQKSIRLVAPTEETNEVGALPQYYADRFGWENMVSTVTSVYAKLTPEQKAECAILAGNYGEAGAIDYYGHLYGLPKAISVHNSYYLWGPGDKPVNTVISIGIPRRDLQSLFENIKPEAKVISRYAMPFESNLTVYVCSGPRIPLHEVWSKAKYYM
jgi:hypothetical protein